MGIFANKKLWRNIGIAAASIAIAYGAYRGAVKAYDNMVTEMGKGVAEYLDVYTPAK